MASPPPPARRKCRGGGGGWLLLVGAIVILVAALIIMFARDWEMDGDPNTGTGYMTKLKIVITHLQVCRRQCSQCKSGVMLPSVVLFSVLVRNLGVWRRETHNILLSTLLSPSVIDTS